MAWIWDQQDSFGLWAAERVSLHSRQHLSSWCGEPHWAEIAGSWSSCLAASPATPISHLWASWAVYTTSVCAVALNPWRWMLKKDLSCLSCMKGMASAPCWAPECSSPFFHQLLPTSAGVLSLIQSNVAFYKVVHPLGAETWQKVFLVFFFNLMKIFFKFLEDFCQKHFTGCFCAENPTSNDFMSSWNNQILCCVMLVSHGCN